MMTANLLREVRPVIESAEVLPRTLVIKSMYIPGGEAHGVYGAADRRSEPNVWVASFFDKDEAETWIEGSKHFGQAVKGGVVGQARTNSREVPEAASGASIGGMREVSGDDSGGAGSADKLSGQVSLLSGNQVVGGRDGAGASTAPPSVVEGPGPGRVCDQVERGSGSFPDGVDTVS
jgi:hypothetical protein